MNIFRYFKKILGVIAVLFMIYATLFPGIGMAATLPAPTSSGCTFIGELKIIPDPNYPNEIDVIPPTVIVNDASGCAFIADSIKLPEALRVDRAIVQLPVGESGVVKSLQINQIDDENNKTLIYGCSNLKVANGTNLNVSCGGPSYLPANKSLEYTATIADFKPGTNFAITLIASKSIRKDL